MALSPHMEMYLKTVLVLEERNEVVRSKDIAAELDLSRPSVTKAISTLSKLGYLTHQPYMHLALTPKGRQIARSVMKRHQVLRTFLVQVLGVSEEIADEDACSLEHVVSPQTLKRLTDFLSFLSQCPMAPNDVMRHFQEVAGGAQGPSCTQCGLDRLLAPELLQPQTPVPRQHQRF